MTNNDKIWCNICQDFIAKNELRFWNGDGLRNWVCPGCGTTMITIDLDRESDERTEGETNNE